MVVSRYKDIALDSKVSTVPIIVLHSSFIFLLGNKVMLGRRKDQTNIIIKFLETYARPQCSALTEEKSSNFNFYKN